MAFELTDLIRDPVTDRVELCVYNASNNGTLEAGQWLQVQIGAPAAPVTLLQIQVPEDKVWQNIRFQFQAQENPV